MQAKKDNPFLGLYVGKLPLIVNERLLIIHDTCSRPARAREYDTVC